MAHNVLQPYAVVCRLRAVGKLRIGAVRCLVLKIKKGEENENLY